MFGFLADFRSSVSKGYDGLQHSCDHGSTGQHHMLLSSGSTRGARGHRGSSGGAGPAESQPKSRRRLRQGWTLAPEEGSIV